MLHQMPSITHLVVGSKVQKFQWVTYMWEITQGTTFTPKYNTCPPYYAKVYVFDSLKKKH